MVVFEVASWAAVAACLLRRRWVGGANDDDDDDEAPRRALRSQTTPGTAGCQERPDHV
jgi:hypothetical protein